MVVDSYGQAPRRPDNFILDAMVVTPRLPRFVLRVVVLYAACALLWVLLSDQWVNRFASDMDEVTFLSELKGLVFIAVSSVFLYALLARLARKLVAQAGRLQEVARRYQTLFEHGGEPMLVVGADDGIIHEANQAAAEMYGWPPDVLKGRALEQLIASPPDDLSPDMAARVSHWHRTAGGERIPVDLVSDAMRWKGDSAHLVVVRDISDQLEQRATLSRLAHQDPLTGLFNRNMLPEQARMGIAHANRTGTLFAVCFIDLDGFKAVNDRLGHDAGDQLLRQIARRIKTEVRGGDVVVRLGGDEFVVLLGELRSLDESEQILRRLLASMAEPVELGGEQAQVTGSIGVAVFPADGRNHESLLRAADEAMYRAKAAGKNRYVFHNKAHEDRLKARDNMLDRVARAISDKKLSLMYVPVVDAGRGTTLGLEARMRWRHPVLGILRASDFLPFIKDPALEHEVDLWAIEQIRHDIGSQPDDLSEIRLNLFAPERSHAELLAALRPLAELLGPERLVVEMSPPVLRRMGSHLGAFRDACHALGIRLSLDGVVAGADSIQSLAALGLDEFKLPVEALGLGMEGEGVAALAAAYNALASAWCMGVVVKGVATAAQRQWLLDHGCTVQQGTLFGAAIEVGEMAELIHQVRETTMQVNTKDPS